jgi:predicted helicase
MTLAQYLAALDRQYRTGIAREHAYRGDLQQLLTALCPGVLVTNEPARIACGAPDYILTKKDIPVGYVEAKDIGIDLGSKSLKEQFDRYRGSLDNLIITDYLEFRFFKNGEHTTTVRIGEVVGGKIKPVPGAFDSFTALIADFAAWQGQTIGSAKKLAAMMAGKARLLADVIEAAVSSDEQTQANTNLKEQLDAFKNILIHDINPKAFADLYAQTIAYGMFAARLHDPTPESFSRMEAATLIPKSNPFLRKLFQSISGYDLDERIAWIVDALADIFRATDIDKLLKGFGKGSGREDAFMHFYEDFLAQYDPKLRKSRGVWYTPDAVVRFIVRAVDDILKTEFGLIEGLAHAGKVTIKRKVVTQGRHGNAKLKEVTVEEKVHRVQVLDPATGTGTFLAEVVRQVHSKFEGQEGMWPRYVEQHLIPRLNGFELLMASYAMAHLKLDLVLRDTGYDMGQPHGTPNQNLRAGGVVRPSAAEAQQRLRVFLTNSLEEAHPDTGTLFASWLSQEANEANAVKRDTPVMVVLGNPPYSKKSGNTGTWIQEAIQVYKKDLNEKKENLGDDYIKFIRYGQHLIDKTGEGVLAFITNNSFIDGITHRQMRRSLLDSFDVIHVLDLHGSATRKETSHDGSKDENVFDIKQGVSVNIFVKRRSKKSEGPARVLHHDVFGIREFKTDYLRTSTLASIEWRELPLEEPYLFFVPKNFAEEKDYNAFTYLPYLFPLNSNGIETHRDPLMIQFDGHAVERIVSDLRGLREDEFKIKHSIIKEGSEWKVKYAQADLLKGKPLMLGIEYRPFDMRHTAYSKNSKGLLARPRHDVMRHMINNDNLALCLKRQAKFDFTYAFVANKPAEACLFESAFAKVNLFPLYRFPATSAQASTLTHGVVPNLNEELAWQLARGVGLSYAFKPEALFAHGSGKELTPLDVLDYCYAVLHSPTYRAKYKEFLKIDFPRIPFPTDAKKFRALVKLGARLRQLHLLEDPAVDRFITKYPSPGDNTVTRKMSERSPGWEATSGKSASGQLGRVWINDQQYFADVPEVAWNFYIGGYQPAQKWLKDRNGRQLTFDDIRHYQRMIVALTETGKCMEEVDGVGVV